MLNYIYKSFELSLIKKIGIKKYLIYIFLVILESILNLPYKLIRAIFVIPYYIIEFINDKYEDYIINKVFRRPLLIYLSRNKKIMNFVKDIRKCSELNNFYIKGKEEIK